MMKHKTQSQDGDRSGTTINFTKPMMAIVFGIGAAAVLMFLPGIWGGLLHIDLSTPYWKWQDAVDKGCEQVSTTADFHYDPKSDQRTQCDSLSLFGGDVTHIEGQTAAHHTLSTMRFFQSSQMAFYAFFGSVIAILIAIEFAQFLAPARKASA